MKWMAAWVIVMIVVLGLIVLSPLWAQTTTRSFPDDSSCDGLPSPLPSGWICPGV